MRRYPYTIATLISKYLRGELTEEESNALQQWVQEKEENSQLLESFLDREKIQEDVTYVSNIDVDAAWRQVRKKQQKKRPIYRYAGAAAALVLLAIAGWFMLPSGKKTTH